MQKLENRIGKYVNNKAKRQQLVDSLDYHDAGVLGVLARSFKPGSASEQQLEAAVQDYPYKDSFSPFGSVKDRVERLKPHLRYLKEGDPPLGRLYEVHVALGDDEILDWDTPIKDHHPDAKRRIEEAYDQNVGLPRTSASQRGKDIFSGMDGSEVYSEFKRYLRTQPAASKALASHGIRGIRYRDAQSRAPSTDLYLDGEKIEPFDGTKEHHLHREAVDEDWGFASQVAALPSLRAGTAKEDLDGLIQRLHGNGLADWLRANKHRVQLKQSRGTYNYVVFDPKDIRVVRKYGRKNELIHDFGDGPVHLGNVEGDNQK